MLQFFTILTFLGITSYSWAENNPKDHCKAWTDYMVGTFVQTERSPKFEGFMFGNRLNILDLAPFPKSFEEDLKSNQSDALEKFKQYDQTRKKLLDAKVSTEQSQQTKIKKLQDVANKESTSAWKALWAYGAKNNCMPLFLKKLQDEQAFLEADRTNSFIDKTQKQIVSLQKANSRALAALDECKAGAPSTVAANVTKQIQKIKTDLEKNCPECIESSLTK